MDSRSGGGGQMLIGTVSEYAVRGFQSMSALLDLGYKRDMSPAATKVRLTVTVSKTTDRDVRALLGARQMRRGELSRFVEQAMQVQLFRLMVDGIKEHNAKLDPNKLQSDVDQALAEVRAEGRSVSQRKKTGATRASAVA